MRSLHVQQVCRFQDFNHVRQISRNSAFRRHFAPASNIQVGSFRAPSFARPWLELELQFCARNETRVVAVRRIGVQSTWSWLRGCFWGSGRSLDVGAGAAPASNNLMWLSKIRATFWCPLSTISAQGCTIQEGAIVLTAPQTFQAPLAGSAQGPGEPAGSGDGGCEPRAREEGREKCPDSLGVLLVWLTCPAKGEGEKRKADQSGRMLGRWWEGWMCLKMLLLMCVAFVFLFGIQ